MWRTAIPVGLTLLALAAIGCGGAGKDGGREEPATGVQTFAGGCKPDPDAARERREQVSTGEMTRKEAMIEEITEVRTCEVERHALEFKQKICSVEIGEASLKGKMDAAQARQLLELQERAKC